MPKSQMWWDENELALLSPEHREIAMGAIDEILYRVSEDKNSDWVKIQKLKDENRMLRHLVNSFLSKKKGTSEKARDFLDPYRNKVWRK